jgi:D-aminopeptidase
VSAAPVVGRLPAGPRDSIADVAGVGVGHCTLAEGAIQTGVTVVRPHRGDVFADKVPAAAVVINGYGKSAGLLQVNELGVIETPIALATTLSVGAVATAQVRATIAAHADLARTTTTVNPLVFECHDGYLNDAQALVVSDAHYLAALAAAAPDFACGSVGAGRGMSCFGLKGGIGTASRVVTAGGQPCTLGALVLANFGRLEALVVAGRRLGTVLGERLARRAEVSPQRDQGSVIVLLAADAPLDHRQLRRIATRAAAGIGRTGGYYGHGSGDIALAFSTAHTVPHRPEAPVLAARTLVETELEPLFEAAAEATEQAILDALFAAGTVTGFAGHVRYALTDLAPDWKALLA